MTERGDLEGDSILPPEYVAFKYIAFFFVSIETPSHVQYPYEKIRLTVGVFDARLGLRGGRSIDSQHSACERAALVVASQLDYLK
ncbi:hypothetical protein AYI70_g4560 [Smittium culicis]|uniref:Uncharacterized protein n=1 Tax=Smittium culicis TaxID=133412 RepID=A0A1R1XYF2_9FUNG|nr:hypothetical protein AYI70_g4560 [Smittium culicis]